MPIVTPEELKREAEEEQIKEEQRENERISLFIKYKQIFGSPNGLEVLKDLEKFCGFSRCSYGNKNDPYDTVFYEGMRNVYLYIKDKIEKELTK